MEEGVRKNSTPTISLESSMTPKEHEDVEFTSSKFENVVESMTYEIKQVMDAFKDDLHAIKGDILNELRILCTLKFFNREEDEEIKNVRSQSHTR